MIEKERQIEIELQHQIDEFNKLNKD
ncbi:Protein of unknown function [Bacillus cereus]|nr:Protein of unknown function [Bacillus cereus]